MQISRLDESQTSIMTAGKNISDFRYADDPTLMAENEEELQSLLRRVKDESEKDDLKLNIQNPKITGCSSVTSWQIDGEKMETVIDLIFLITKITENGDYSNGIKRCLFLGRKAYDQPRQHIKKQRHYFADKGPSSQGCGFSSSHV